MPQIICYTQDCIHIQTLLQRHRFLNIKVLSQGFSEDINTLFKCILSSACRWRETAMDSILLFKVDY